MTFGNRLLHRGLGWQERKVSCADGAIGDPLEKLKSGFMDLSLCLDRSLSIFGGIGVIFQLL